MRDFTHYLVSMNKTANAVKTNSSTKVHISDQMDFSSGIQLANRKGFRLATLNEVISRYTHNSDFRKELDESKGWAVVDYNSTLKEGNCELFENGTFRPVRDNAYDKLPGSKRGHIYNNGPGHVIVCCAEFIGDDRRLEISTNPKSHAPIPMRFAYVEDKQKPLIAAARR